jgi:DNA-binding MarR family transcriptional regulator
MTATVPPAKTYSPDIIAASLTLLKIFHRLRDRHQSMSILQAMCLVQVAAQPGINQKTLYEELGATGSSASRILALLSDVGDRNTAGLDLVKATAGGVANRERKLYLTPKGKRLIEEIVEDLQKDSKLPA